MFSVYHVGRLVWVEVCYVRSSLYNLNMANFSGRNM